MVIAERSITVKILITVITVPGLIGITSTDPAGIAIGIVHLSSSVIHPMLSLNYGQSGQPFTDRLLQDPPFGFVN
ncbi:MAG: hypothetical protein HKP18_12780 [Acidimicrobiia bacterium]|nr:hypothetical protein [Acidimicrobiia bacterium]